MLACRSQKKNERGIILTHRLAIFQGNGSYKVFAEKVEEAAMVKGRNKYVEVETINK